MRHMYMYIYIPFEVPLFVTIDVWQVIFLEVEFGQETTKGRQAPPVEDRPAKP